MLNSPLVYHTRHNAPLFPAKFILETILAADFEGFSGFLGRNDLICLEIIFRGVVTSITANEASRNHESDG